MSRFTTRRNPATIILGNYVFAVGVALVLLVQGCAPRLAGSVAAGQRRLAEINACLGNGSDRESKCLTKITPFEGDIDEPAIGCFRYDDFTPQPVEFVASPSGLVVKGSSAPALDFTTARLRSEGAAPVLKALGDGHYTRGCLVPATEAVAKLLGRGDVDPNSVVERMLRDVAAGKGTMRAEVPSDLEAVRAYQERHPLATSGGACVSAIDGRLALAATLPIQLTEDDRDAQKRKAFFAGLKGSWRAAMGPDAATPEELRAAAMLVYGEEPWAEKLQAEVAEKLGAGPNAWRKGLGLDACIVKLAHRIKPAAVVAQAPESPTLKHEDAVIKAAAPVGAPVAPAAAPVADEKAAKDEARKFFDEGKKLFDAGKVAEAVEVFKKADAKLPGAAPRLRIAEAYEKLNKPAEAVAAYRAFLSLNPTGKFAEKIPLAKERIAAIEVTLPATLTAAKEDLTESNDSIAVPAGISDSARVFGKARDEADKASAAVYARRVDVVKRRLEPVFAACLSTQSATDARCDSLEGLSVGEREACRTGCRMSAGMSRTKAAAAECKNSWADKAVVCGQPGELGEAGHARCQEACRKSTGEASSFAFQRAYETCWQGNGPTTCEVASDPYTKGGYSAELFKTKIIDCSKNCATERRERLKREASERAEAAQAAQEAARQRAEEAREAAAAEARDRNFKSCFRACYAPHDGSGPWTAICCENCGRTGQGWSCPGAFD